jgi:hypothetical protein
MKGLFGIGLAGVVVLMSHGALAVIDQTNVKITSVYKNIISSAIVETCNGVEGKHGFTANLPIILLESSVDAAFSEEEKESLKTEVQFYDIGKKFPKITLYDETVYPERPAIVGGFEVTSYKKTLDYWITFSVIKTAAGTTFRVESVTSSLLDSFNSEKMSPQAKIDSFCFVGDRALSMYSDAQENAKAEKASAK